MTDTETPLHIIELRASNIKRLRAVRIRPDGEPLVLLGGENTQGKTSCLDAIAMALGGAKEIPLEPVRHGARQGDVALDLGEFRIERTFTAKGTELIVRDKEGVPQASPQKLLDKLCAKVCFDPLKFMTMEPKQQDALLKQMLGLDFSDIEGLRAKAYENRSNVNREVKRLEALLDEHPEDPTASVEFIDVAVLAEQIQTHTNAVGSRRTLVAMIESDRRRLRERDAEIDALKQQLVNLTEARMALCSDIDERQAKLPPEPAPIDAVREKLRTAEATNEKVRANATHRLTKKQLEDSEDLARAYTDTIAGLDRQKAERLAAATFPIEGLGFDDAGPTFNGVPLAQASQAEQLRVSVAIGAAQHPRIRVMLVREGSRLDKASLKLLAELARETDSQVWVERVSDGDPGAVIIDDGCVVERNAAAGAA